MLDHVRRLIPAVTPKSGSITSENTQRNTWHFKAAVPQARSTPESKVFKANIILRLSIEDIEVPKANALD